MKEQFISRKKAYAILTLVCLVSAAVAFQNCSGKTNFVAGANGEGSNLASSGSEANSGSQSIAGGDNSTSLASSMVHVEGQLYGHCTLQLDGSFNIKHNGAYDSSGVKLPNVPAGVGGATWPVTVCPNSGSGSGAPVRCADGFKAVAHESSQMDCSTSEGAAFCKTYWVTYNCAKISPTRSAATGSGSSGSGTTTPVQTLKWVYTNPTTCVGPTPAPAVIGSACSPAGTTATNDCGTATCQ